VRHLASPYYEGRRKSVRPGAMKYAPNTPGLFDAHFGVRIEPYRASFVPAHGPYPKAAIYENEAPFSGLTDEVPQAEESPALSAGEDGARNRRELRAGAGNVPPSAGH
jgi:hypothetical protein